MRKPCCLYCFFLFPCLFLIISCSSTPTTITAVDEYIQNKTDYLNTDYGYSRTQSAYHLYHKLTDQQRKDTLGQYYTVSWYDATPETDTDVTFTYQRANLGSKKLNRTVHYPKGRQGGTIETSFNFTGKDKRDFGSITTWKAQVIQNGKILSQKTSFLWEE